MVLPIPVERQREVVCLPATGHQVVLGTVGSGKTTMAILRAAFLADPEMPSYGRTLLLTYNKALCAYIRTIAAPELSHVTVEHYHKFARGYLALRGKMRWNSIARKGPREKAIEAGVECCGRNADGFIIDDRNESSFCHCGVHRRLVLVPRSSQKFAASPIANFGFKGNKIKGLLVSL